MKLIAIAAISLAPGETIAPGSPFDVEDKTEAKRLKDLGFARDPENEAPGKGSVAQKKLDEAEARAEFLKEANADLTAENTSLKSKLTSAQSEISGLKSSLSTAQSSLAAAQTDAADLKAKLAAAQAELVDLKKKPAAS